VQMTPLSFENNVAYEQRLQYESDIYPVNPKEAPQHGYKYPTYIKAKYKVRAGEKISENIKNLISTDNTSNYRLIMFAVMKVNVDNEIVYYLSPFHKFLNQILDPRHPATNPSFIIINEKNMINDEIELKLALITDNKRPYQLQKTVLKLTSDYDLNKSQKEQTGSVLDIKNQGVVDRQHVYLFVALVQNNAMIWDSHCISEKMMPRRRLSKQTRPIEFNDQISVLQPSKRKRLKS
ncbi:unnamed protein product, partial [Didymodactylos carnosus]